MSTQEEFSIQIEHLGNHRKTLAHYLKQQAQLGSAYAPPGVTHGIEEARSNIQRIKTTIRDWGYLVEDHPDDFESPADRQTKNLSLLWTGDMATIPTETGFIFEQSKYDDKFYHIILYIKNNGTNIIHHLYIVLDIPQNLIFSSDINDILHLHIGGKSNWSTSISMDLVRATFKSNGNYSVYPEEIIHACTIMIPISPSVKYPSSCIIKCSSMSEWSTLISSDCTIQIEPEDFGRKK